MRLLIGAAVAACLIAAPAAAQDTTATTQPPLVSNCGDMPALPQLPDGANANERAMQQGQDRFTAWRTAAEPVIQCRNAEMTAWRQQYEAIGARNEADGAAATAFVTNWGVEVEEFNARGARRSNRGNSGAPPTQN